MNVKQLIAHPVVVGFVFPLLASLLAYKMVKYFESKPTGTSTAQVPKQAARIPVQQATVEKPQEVTTM